jgi:hypothetical protein
LSASAYLEAMPRERADNEAIDEHTELVILTLLLEPGEPAQWSLAELGRELGDALQASDAVASLEAAGLVRRSADLVTPTRAARRFSRLIGGL